MLSSRHIPGGDATGQDALDGAAEELLEDPKSIFSLLTGYSTSGEQYLETSIILNIVH